MLCPVCSKPLIVVERHKIELDYCPHKHGIWFDTDELELLPLALQKDFKVPTDLYNKPSIHSSELKRDCPRCKTKMDKIYINDSTDSSNQTIIDRCPNKHGFWFDRGELSTLVNNINRESPGESKEILKFLGEVFHL
ncbi:MAG: zf-TFIIB domain-containing protein [Candidatus Caenarcaniphilales bacterium]|nr:zf-TFIIB domain-containing protein [Candidatus Caenarcaniphilales bacterium]